MNGRRAGGALLAAALAVLAAGCASLQTPAGPAVAGRMSLQVAADADQPARGLNGRFDLRGTAEAGELRLSTTLGPQVAAARWRPGEVVLIAADGESRFASLSALSRALFGEDLPLQALPDWLQGRPWPGAPHVAGPASFEQLGWTVDLARQGEGFITASRRTAPAVTLRVRLEAS